MTSLPAEARLHRLHQCAGPIVARCAPPDAHALIPREMRGAHRAVPCRGLGRRRAVAMAAVWPAR
jgi:hypothetical protein